MDYFDFVFLDHEKEDYLPTLLKLTELKLIRKDSVIIADNAIYPGCARLRKETDLGIIMMNSGLL